MIFVTIIAAAAYHKITLKKLSGQCLEVDDVPVCFINDHGIVVSWNNFFEQIFLVDNTAEVVDGSANKHQEDVSKGDKDTSVGGGKTGINVNKGGYENTSGVNGKFNGKNNIALVDCMKIVNAGRQVVGEDDTGRKWILRYMHVYSKTMIIFIPMDTDMDWIYRLPVPCCIIDSAHCVQYVNQQMLEYIDKNWKGEPFERFLSRTRIRDFQVCVEKAGERPAYMDTLWGVKNIPIKLSVVGLNQHMYCICLHNIEEIEIVKQKAYMAQNLQLMGQLTAGVIHDFNNVINAISLLMYSMQEKLSDGMRGESGGKARLMGLEEGAVVMNHEVAREMQDDMHAVHTTTARAQELIKQLLEFSKDKQDSHENDPVVVVKSFIHSLVVLAGEKVKLHVSIDAPQVLVNLSAAQILQIVLNLIVNARDAGAKDIWLEMKHLMLIQPKSIYTGILSPKHYIVISVKDNGGGIPKQNMGNVFNAFFSTKKTGSGLGLATIHRLATMHSGGIDLHSSTSEVLSGNVEMGNDGRNNADKGNNARREEIKEIGTTRFDVYLPCRSENGEKDLNAAMIEQNSKYNILLIDDDETGRNLMNRALLRNGYKVVACEDGVKGLEMLEKMNGVSLVITDAIMPNMNGIQLIKQIREKNRGMPIILISGFSTDELKDSVSDDVVLLSKPVQISMMIYTIDKLLKK